MSCKAMQNFPPPTNHNNSPGNNCRWMLAQVPLMLLEGFWRRKQRGLKVSRCEAPFLRPWTPFQIEGFPWKIAWSAVKVLQLFRSLCSFISRSLRARICLLQAPASTPLKPPLRPCVPLHAPFKPPWSLLAFQTDGNKKKRLMVCGARERG